MNVHGKSCVKILQKLFSCVAQTKMTVYKLRMTWESVNSYFDNDIKTTCAHTHLQISHMIYNPVTLGCTKHRAPLSNLRSNSGPLWMIKIFSDEIGFVVFPGTDGTRLLFWAALARKGTSHVISSLWSLFLNPDGTDWAMCSKVSTLVFGPAAENCWQKFKLSCHFISIHLNFA